MGGHSLEPNGPLKASHSISFPHGSPASHAPLCHALVESGSLARSISRVRKTDLDLFIALRSLQNRCASQRYPFIQYTGPQATPYRPQATASESRYARMIVSPAVPHQKPPLQHHTYLETTPRWTTPPTRVRTSPSPIPRCLLFTAHHCPPLTSILDFAVGPFYPLPLTSSPEQ